MDNMDNIDIPKGDLILLGSPLPISNNVQPSDMDVVITKLMAAGYPKSVIDSVVKARDDIVAYDALDKKLIEILKDLSSIEKTPLYETVEYSEVIKSIDSSSYVISFKNAGLFKVYTPEMLSTLNMQANSQFKGVNEIYEVVNRDSRQKIIIMIDGSVENEVEKIKNYVMAFFKKQQDMLHDDDIISYRNPITGDFEMMINRFVNNYNEKKEIVSKLTTFIGEEEEKIGGTTKMESKISYRTISNIKNADIFPIPAKRGLNINPIDWLPHHVQASSNPSNSTNVFNIFNITGENIAIGNDNNVSNIEKTVTRQPKQKNDIQIFVEYIKNNKPSWYKEGNYVKISDLYEQFKKVTRSTILCNMFSKKVKNILFSESVVNTIDGINARRAMLWNISDL